MVRNGADNVLNTTLKVANRYSVSSKVVVLDHRWRLKKQGKACVVIREAKNYEVLCLSIHGVYVRTEDYNGNPYCS